MRVTTALTTVMFALLIGMLSAPPAEAGKIRKSTTTGTRVTAVANDVTNGTTVNLLTVPSKKQFILRGFCVSQPAQNPLTLQSPDLGRVLNFDVNLDLDCGPDVLIHALNANAGGPSFGPGDVVQFRNDAGSGDRDVTVWGDLVKD